MECVACGRRLTNAEEPNQAGWTLDPYDIGNQLPYCLDSADCARDAYAQLGIEYTP